METYTTDEMNAAITRVESAKRKHPIGWGFLSELNLEEDELVVYAFSNADAHAKRLEAEEDHRIIYCTGWLQGLGIGVALAEQRS